MTRFELAPPRSTGGCFTAQLHLHGTLACTPGFEPGRTGLQPVALPSELCAVSLRE